MRIETFSLCDAATADGGKLSMLGAFDSIFTEKVPVIHPQCTIAMRIRFEKMERGEHKIMVNFSDADGKHIIPSAQGPIMVNFSDEQSSGAINLIFNIQGLQLMQFGEYSIDLAIDGRHEACLPLFVKNKPVNQT